LVFYSVWLLITDGASLEALGILLAGRSLDLLDGYAADKTRTKGVVGEAVDAVADKIEIGVIIIGVGIAGLVPFAALTFILLRVAWNGVVSFIAKKQKQLQHTVKYGKLATALEWAVVTFFVLAALDSLASGLHVFFSILAWLSLALFVIAASNSTYRYTIELART
jgi:phosphatidylglycerophosphate synthase